MSYLSLVYFDQPPGAMHTQSWLNYNFWLFPDVFPSFHIFFLIYRWKTKKKLKKRSFSATPCIWLKSLLRKGSDENLLPHPKKCMYANLAILATL